MYAQQQQCWQLMPSHPDIHPELLSPRAFQSDRGERSYECVGVCLAPATALSKRKSKLKNIAFGHWLAPPVMSVRLCV